MIREKIKAQLKKELQSEFVPADRVEEIEFLLKHL
jgi:hypothetical protein